MYHINSLSASLDGESFISSDDLNLYLWNLEMSNKTYKLVDIKPPNIEELTEVITCSSFVSSNDYNILYGTSKSIVKMIDIREN